MSCAHPKAKCPWCGKPLCLRCAYSRLSDQFQVKPGVYGICAHCIKLIVMDDTLYPQRFDPTLLDEATRLEYERTLFAFMERQSWPRRDAHVPPP